MATIAEFASGFPGISTRIPFETGIISEVLAGAGYNTYCVGKWHLTPGEECNVAAYKGRWPLGRGFERYYGWLGGETNSLLPGPDPRQPPDRAAGAAGGRLPPGRRPLEPGDPVHPGRQDDRPGQAVLHVLRAAGRSRPAPGAAGVGRPLQGRVRRGLRGDAPGDPRAADRAGPAARRARSCPASTRTASRHRTGPNGEPWPLLDTVRPWESLSDDEQRLFVRMAEVFAGYISYYDDRLGRIIDYLEQAGELDNTLIVVVSDNGSSGEGGPNGTFNEWRFFNGIADTTELVLRAHRRARHAGVEQPLQHRLGLGPGHARSRTGSGGPATRAAPPTCASCRGRRGSRRARRCGTSTSTRSTSSRRSTTCWASRRPR